MLQRHRGPTIQGQPSTLTQPWNPASCRRTKHGSRMASMPLHRPATSTTGSSEPDSIVSSASNELHDYLELRRLRTWLSMVLTRERRGAFTCSYATFARSPPFSIAALQYLAGLLAT
ncbi:hypothetical protein MRX96_039866 [Rhipicephalus microplus]